MLLTPASQIRPSVRATWMKILAVTVFAAATVFPLQLKAQVGLAEVPVRALVFDPTNPLTMYAGLFGNRVAKSVDGGVNWTIAEDVFGIGNEPVTQIVPVSPSTIYASSQSAGFQVVVSTDGGATWDSIPSDNSNLVGCNEPFANCFSGGFRSLAVRSNGDIIAGASNAGPSSVFVNTTNVWFPTSYPSVAAQVLKIDPASDSRILAGSLGGGIYVSADGGFNWAESNTGIASGLDVRDIQFAPSSSSVVYASGQDREIYRSDNSGESWVERNNGMMLTIVETIAVDPTNPDIAYAGSFFGFNGRIFKTTDGGQNWFRSDTGLENSEAQSVRKLLVYPNDANIIYAATDDGVYQSRDGGANWSIPPVEPPPPPLPPVSSANYTFASSDVDPVNTFSGELYNFYDPDLNLGGPFPLVFARYYGAFLARSSVVGDFGNNWRHNYDDELVVSGSSAVYISAYGRTTEFTLTGGSWVQQNNLDIPCQLVAPSGVDATLYCTSDELFRTFDLTSGGALDGTLLTVSDGRGNTHTVTRNATTGRLESISDGLGRTLSFTYNADTLPKLETVTDGSRVVQYAYTDGVDEDILTEVLDVMSERTTYAYSDTSGTSEIGLLTSTTLPRGNTCFSQTFDGMGRVTSQTDGEGNITTLAYGGADTTLTDPGANSRVHTHNSDGEFMSRADQNGESFEMLSDDDGRRTGITDRGGETTSWTYDAASGLVNSVTDGSGATTSIVYAARAFQGATVYDPTSITLPDGTTETRAYDGSGNLTSRVDGTGATTSFTYNGRGQILTSTNPLNGVTTRTYNGDGTLASWSDPASNTTTFSYDLNRHLARITLADANTVDFVFDDAGRLTSTTDERGNSSAVTYDTNGNVASITDADSNTRSYTYDDNDRLVSIEDSDSSTVQFTYTSRDRIATRTNENGDTVNYGYNARNRLASITDAESSAWQFTYDDEGAIASMTNPLGDVTQFTADGAGRLAQTTTAIGSVYAVSYDGFGRFIQTVDPLGGTTDYERNSTGVITGVTLPDDSSVSYTVDGAGHVTASVDGEGNSWERQRNSQGQIVALVDPLGRSQSVTYTNRNQVATVTYPDALGSVTQTYDASNNLLEQSFSDGTQSNYTYDALDRVTSATGVTRAYDANSRVVASNGITATRDPGGRVETMTLAPGKTLTYTYDGNDRVVRLVDWVGGETTFSYDAAGRLTGMSRPNAITLAQTWDADGHVSGVTDGSLVSIALTRDARGHITDATRTVPVVSSATMLSSSSDTFDSAAQRVGPTYDAVGRITSDGADTYTWNLGSQLTAYQVGSTMVTAAYDAFNRRTSKSVGGTTTNWVWNDMQRLPTASIARDGATDSRYYVYTPSGALLYSIDATDDSRRFYHFDETGNTLAVTDDTGATLASYAYTPFGEVIGSTGAIDNPFTWQGQSGAMDEGNGLFYMRARYYDSRSGRFLSRDPAKSLQPQSLNPYQYAWNNPMRFMDPTGFAPEEVDAIKKLREMGIIGERLAQPLVDYNIDGRDAYMSDDEEHLPDTGAAELQNATRGTSGINGPEFARKEAARLHAIIAEKVKLALKLSSQTPAPEPPKTTPTPPPVTTTDARGVNLDRPEIIRLPFKLPPELVFAGQLVGFESVPGISDYLEALNSESTGISGLADDSLLDIEPTPPPEDSVIDELPPIIVLA
ncbi:MAG: RHS repeat-associated core domain-containing protein [Myxococcota bacterium]